MNGSNLRKKMELFFSDEMRTALYKMQKVTWNDCTENENSEVISLKWLGDNRYTVDLSGETTAAYGGRIADYCPFFIVTDELYSFEVDSLTSSYDPVKSYRRGVTAVIMHSVLLAKHLWIEKLRVIRRHY